MSTSLNYQTSNGNWSIADIDYKRMIGQPGVGFYRLIIGLSLHQSFQIGEEKRRIGLRDIRGELFIVTQGRGDLLMAKFVQPDQRVFEPYEYMRSTEFTLETEIDGWRINALETLRQGGDIQAKLKLRGIGYDCSTLVPTPCEAHDMGFQITQSDWIKVLKGMNYRKIFLLEVEEPDSAGNPNLAEAVKHLFEAQGHISRGHFRSAVAECRNAIDIAKPFFAEEEEIPEEVKTWLKTDHRMTKEQRLARIGILIGKLTSLAHHSDATSRSTEWQPEDARAILAMTTAILQMIPNQESW